MKYLLVLFLAIINVKSQLLLNIKSLDTDNNSKIIVMEIYNNSNITCSIPIDTVSFKPFGKQYNAGNFRPLIELKRKNKSVNYETGLIELDETQIDLANKRNQLTYLESKEGIIKIKPKEKLVIPIKFNPFQFNVENGKYDSFNIISNQDYTITVYLTNCGSNSPTHNKEKINYTIKSNPIRIKWNLKNTKYIKW
ncbi:hypothetical protein [Chryseobacterium sp. ON_d1]|uniref:hypothetical protein n=1 Tax=Chryseobacterium sp. ON_d1 TaxID=2583211 RepID=UPI0011587B55|nr:hypothetical protein [Chryseobacterium sp. ON_d1]GEJ45533.1 hypothetical protein CRS_21410 [Chryseobacterium sp. ON_d1]